MTCMGGFAPAWQALPPGLEDLRAILGDIASLHLR
jgi:hypothetical protein